MNATLTAEPRTRQPRVTVEDYLFTLWGIRPGESRPTVRSVPVAHAVDDAVAEWLYRLWGIGSRP